MPRMALHNTNTTATTFVKQLASKAVIPVLVVIISLSITKSAKLLGIFPTYFYLVKFILHQMIVCVLQNLLTGFLAHLFDHLISLFEVVLYYCYVLEN